MGEIKIKMHAVKDWFIRKSNQKVYQYSDTDVHTSIVGHTAKIQHIQEIIQTSWSAIEKTLTFIYIFIPLCLLKKKKEWTIVFINIFSNYHTTDHKPCV